MLADKALVDKDSYTEIDSSNPPVAIIAGVNGYGRAIGIALHISTSGLEWAKDGSTGYNTRFIGRRRSVLPPIICTRGKSISALAL